MTNLIWMGNDYMGNVLRYKIKNLQEKNRTGASHKESGAS